jgi:hypothetical protein
VVLDGHGDGGVVAVGLDRAIDEDVAHDTGHRVLDVGTVAVGHLGDLLGHLREDLSEDILLALAFLHRLALLEKRLQVASGLPDREFDLGLDLGDISDGVF